MPASGSGLGQRLEQLIQSGLVVVAAGSADADWDITLLPAGESNGSGSTLTAADPVLVMRTGLPGLSAVPATLEDLVTGCRALIAAWNFPHGIVVSRSSAALSFVAASFATNLNAFHQGSLLTDELSRGYEVLGLLLENMRVELCEDRGTAVRQFLGGAAPFVFDDAHFVEDIRAQATLAGFDVISAPVPMGPSGLPTLLLPGLDLVVNAALDVEASAGVANIVAQLTVPELPQPDALHLADSAVLTDPLLASPHDVVGLAGEAAAALDVANETRIASVNP